MQPCSFHILPSVAGYDEMVLAISSFVGSTGCTSDDQDRVSCHTITTTELDFREGAMDRSFVMWYFLTNSNKVVFSK